jgi:nitrite reductase/ring-hydroxylating ferredoxin subunit
VVEKNMPAEEMSRRIVLKVSFSLAGLLGLGALLKYLGYQAAPVNLTRFTLKTSQDYPAASVTSLPEAKAWLFCDEQGLYAISAVCTHSDQGFECPCHGSRYNEGGYVLKGPAKLPLNYLELTLSPEGLVVLDTEVSVPAAQRLAVSS